MWYLLVGLLGGSSAWSKFSFHLYSLGSSDFQLLDLSALSCTTWAVLVLTVLGQDHTLIVWQKLLLILPPATVGYWKVCNLFWEEDSKLCHLELVWFCKAVFFSMEVLCWSRVYGKNWAKLAGLSAFWQDWEEGAFIFVCVCVCGKGWVGSKRFNLDPT